MNNIDNDEHVFVVGSSRSGTTLVHTILLSSPIYAQYRAETQILNGCELKYGDLSKTSSKQKFLSDWLRSRQFKRSGLTIKEFSALLFDKNTSSYTLLLSKFMRLIADKQNCQRWVDSTPGYAFYLKQIAEHFPNSKVVHVIRDGRAVALSLAKLGWSGINTNSFDKALCYSAIKWEKSILAARTSKDLLGDRYHEIQYEKLVKNPEQEQKLLSEFLGLTTKLSYENGISRIRSLEQHSTLKKQTNSAFSDMSAGLSIQAVNRWKSALTQTQIRKIESLVGDRLIQLGYTINTEKDLQKSPFINKFRFISGLIHQIKTLPGMGQFTTTPLELDQD